MLIPLDTTMTSLPILMYSECKHDWDTPPGSMRIVNSERFRLLLVDKLSIAIFETIIVVKGSK
jgi:hypothetical protein